MKGPYIFTTVLGWFFLFYGVVNLFIIIWHRHKYKEVLATVISCREYRINVVGEPKRISFSSIFEFVANQKKHQVRQDKSIQEWAYSEKRDRYIVGQKVRIYYKRKNPKDINLDLRNFYKRSCIFCPFFITTGLIALLIRHFLN